MRRIFPVLVCFVLIIGMIGYTVVPARAAEVTATPVYQDGSLAAYNWRDLVRSIQVSGDSNLVVFNLDVSWFYAAIYNDYYDDYPLHEWNGVSAGEYASEYLYENVFVFSPFGCGDNWDEGFYPQYFISSDGLPDSLKIFYTLDFEVYSEQVDASYATFCFAPWTYGSQPDHGKLLFQLDPYFEQSEPPFVYYGFDEEVTIDISNCDAFSFFYTADTRGWNSVKWESTYVGLGCYLSDYWVSSDEEKDEAFRNEIVSQLTDQGKDIKDILAEQEKTNEKLDGIQGSIDDTNDKLDDTNDKLDDIISGGTAGDDLGGASDDLDSDNEQLGGVVGDLESAEDALPSLDENIQTIIQGNISDFGSSDIVTMMPWNDEDYSTFWNTMFLPTLSSLSTSLLLYFVFGKAKV